MLGPFVDKTGRYEHWAVTQKLCPQQVFQHSHLVLKHRYSGSPAKAQFREMSNKKGFCCCC